MNLAPVLRGKKKVSNDRILVINYSRMPGFSNYPSPHSQTQMRADQAAVLWKRWRLLEERELYDLASDPLQKKNVIGEHPEVVAKMRKRLYSWWDGVKHLANEEQRIIIGTKHENPTKLSATEWLDVFVDQQGQIRRGVLKNGYWLIDVARAGEYEIELRRWPKEADGTVSGTLPDGSGTALPINQAMLFVSGHNHLSISQKKAYQFEGLTKRVTPKDKGVTFTMNLKKGPTALHTWFKGKNELTLSAYYVYVTRKEMLNEKFHFIFFLFLFAFGAFQTSGESPILFSFWSMISVGRDVGCYGSQFHETPAIDQLAKEGILFDNAYSTCHVCSPSRASILTGKYPARINLTEWLGGRPERDYELLHHGEKLTALPDEEVTLAETLKRHGYATANYGKAHLRVDPKAYGFDEEITGWVRSYHYPFGGAYNEKLPAKKGDYYTDKLTDAALDFIERNKDKPFFVHLEHFAVHDPIQGRPDLVEKYRKKLAAMPKQAGPDFILESNPDGSVFDGKRTEGTGGE